MVKSTKWKLSPFLKKWPKRDGFWDIVYYDPPYDTNYDEVLKYFEKGVTIRPARSPGY